MNPVTFMNPEKKSPLKCRPSLRRAREIRQARERAPALEAIKLHDIATQSVERNDENKNSSAIQKAANCLV